MCTVLFPARAWAEAAACRKDGGGVLMRMGAGYTSVLCLPAWMMRKLGAAELARLLAEPDRGGDEVATTPTATTRAEEAAAPSARQLARRQRRRRQRERRRASRVDCSAALPSDDCVGGGMCDASSQAHAAATPAARGGGASSVAAAPASSSQCAMVPSVCDAVMPAAAPAAVGSLKRRRAEGGSAGGAGGEVRRAPVVAPVDYERVSALAEAVREELVHNGVPTQLLRLRPLLLGDKLLPQFPVVRGGCAEQASDTALAGSVRSVMQGVVPAFDGLRRLVTEGSDFSDPAVVS